MTDTAMQRRPKRTPADVAVEALCKAGVDPRCIVIDLVDNRVFTVSKPMTSLPKKRGAKGDWSEAFGNGL